MIWAHPRPWIGRAGPANPARATPRGLLRRGGQAARGMSEAGRGTDAEPDPGPANRAANGCSARYSRCWRFAPPPAVITIEDPLHDRIDAGRTGI